MPSSQRFEVAGVFNPAVASLGGETILLLRVAEKPVNLNLETVLSASYDSTYDNIVFKEFSKTDSALDFSDPRLIIAPDGTYLTSLSHLRTARSNDGIHFQIDHEPALFPADAYESFGIEDPRITPIAGTFYITYVSVSPAGVTTSLASTKDFHTFHRLGRIFCPDNKDVTIFPEIIENMYFALHRPVTPFMRKHDIWLAQSPDLIHWGGHKRLIGPRPGRFDSLKTGAGAPPIKTDLGWLEIYHGADENNRYSLGALLLDLKDPSKVLARTDEPIFVPQADYETGGFFANTVFTCGLLNDAGRIKLYYGAADACIALAEFQLSDLQF